VTKAHTERGKETERMLVRYLQAHGFPAAERAVRTGYRSRTRTTVDPGDVTGTPGLVWQAKALRPLTAAENAVPRWLAETEVQRAGQAAALGVLIVRRDQRPAEQWFAFVPLADLYAAAGVEVPAVLLVERDAVVQQATRLYLGDLVTLLRSWGYGDPVVEPTPPATLAPVDLS